MDLRGLPTAVGFFGWTRRVPSDRHDRGTVAARGRCPICGQGIWQGPMRSGTMSRLTLMCIFALFFGEGTAFAQASRGDSVAVSAQADVGPEALSGRRGGLEWVH